MAAATEAPSPSRNAGVASPLRRRLLRVFGGLSVLLLVLVSITTYLVTERMFRLVQLDEARRDRDRLALWLNTASDELRRLAADYAVWDAMADFLVTRDPAFAAESFADEVLQNLKVDGFLILDASGTPVLTARLATPEDQAPAYPGAIGLAPKRPLLLARLMALELPEKLPAVPDGAVLWFEHEGQWLQLGFHPIRRVGSDQVEGTMAFVRRFSEERLRQESELLGFRYWLEAPDGAEAQMERRGATMRFTVPISDPVLGPQAVAVADQDFDLAGLLGPLRLLVIAEYAAVLLVSMIALAFWLDRAVVSRITRLRDAVTAHREPDAPPALGAQTGPPDELTDLVRAYEQLQQRLQDTRQRWERSALRDPLTGLPNRAALQAELVQRKRVGPGGSALHLIDLDGFTRINDLQGHDVGDRLLRAIAMGLLHRFPLPHRLYRLGGDEYALLSEGQTAAEVERAIAEVLSAVSVTVGYVSPLKASIGRVDLGAAVADPLEWLALADIALRTAKRAGGTILVPYSVSLREDLDAAERLQRRVREVLQSEAIHMHFQPIVDAATGAWVAVEALARWPEGEPIPFEPEQFIDAAREGGHAVAFDRLLIRKALADFAVLRERRPGLRLQVNLSPASFLLLDTGSWLHAELARHGVPVAEVLLELTEQALQGTEAQLAEALASLRACGFQLVLDDFGVGHSGLSRLASLAPVGVKIDGQFVRRYREEGGAIIRAIIGLARAFRMTVTAEYVETAAQARFLRDLGCHRLQGHGIARAMPLDTLLHWGPEQAPALRG